jgi:hypothetical protein
VTAFAENFKKFFTYKSVAEIFLNIQNDVSNEEVLVETSQGSTLEFIMQIPQQSSTTRKNIYFLTDGMLCV